MVGVSVCGGSAIPTLLLIGASRGLGRALAEEHLKRGWRVIASVRSSAALDDLSSAHGEQLEVITLDATDWPAVDALRHDLEGRQIDLLLVNAGISGPVTLPIGEVDPDVFGSVIMTNALAPLRLIDRLADLVPSAGTIAVMSSDLGSISRNTLATWEAYRMSKAALNMGLRSISIRRRAEGRTYLALCPGWVRTDMGGPNAHLSIEESIPGLTDVIAARTGEKGVWYVNYQGQDVAW
jgi:NAD(P)-dependent dehydrogenase (short-subunit alcohol dehydrogenase family)